MKVVVQVPCLNEEETLPLVLDSIPRQIEGVDEIVVLVIDDGCTDRTVEVAQQHGVRHFVRHVGTQGLARSFQDGVAYALEMGADVLVNTDGDNQYPQERIADLVAPVIAGRADIVVADRQVHLVEHFSAFEDRAPTSRQSRRQPGCRDASSRRRERVQGLLPRESDETEHRDAVQLLHGVDHPSRQQAAADRERAGSHEPEDP